jgi:hypothetical protein
MAKNGNSTDRETRDKISQLEKQVLQVKEEKRKELQQVNKLNTDQRA